jgi:hypothetical protein
MTFQQFIIENKKQDVELANQINKLGNEVVDNSDGYLLPPNKQFTRSVLMKKGFRIVGSDEVKNEPLQVDIILKNIAVAIQAEFTPVPPLDKYTLKGNKFNESKSRKYVTYVFTKDGISVPIIITNTKPQNVGIQFEIAVHQSLKQQIDNKELIIGGLLDNMIQHIPDIESFENIDGIQYEKGKASRREISSELNNVGKKISDITIQLKSGEDVYISLKTSKNTLSNSGISGMFVEEKNEIKHTSKSFKFKSLLECLRVDYDKFATELTNYKNRTVSINEHTETFIPTTNESDVMIKYLASAYGYGYWLLKYNNLNDVTLMDLNETVNVERLVGGKITSVSVKYPYFSSIDKSTKQLTINLTTENGALYKIELRNVAGDILPDMLQIKNTKESLIDLNFVSKFAIKSIGEMSDAKL